MPVLPEFSVLSDSETATVPLPKSAGVHFTVQGVRIVQWQLVGMQHAGVKD